MKIKISQSLFFIAITLLLVRYFSIDWTAEFIQTPVLTWDCSRTEIYAFLQQGKTILPSKSRMYW